MRTTACVGCAGEPNHVSGHVHHGASVVDASWCDSCANSVSKLQMIQRRGLPHDDCANYAECQGDWLRADGIHGIVKSEHKPGRVLEPVGKGT